MLNAQQANVCDETCSKRKKIFQIVVRDYLCGSLDILNVEMMALDVFEAIQNRRSIRAYTRKSVPDEFVNKLIEAARVAPSAGNIQPWEFVIVRNADLKNRLSVAALNQNSIKEAPLAIVICANETRSYRGYGNRGASLYCLQDTAAAIQNLLLAAHALGLCSCWVGAFHEEEVRAVVKTPEGVRPVAIIPIGYPAEKPEMRSKRPLKDIVHYETF